MSSLLLFRQNSFKFPLRKLISSRPLIRISPIYHGERFSSDSAGDIARDLSVEKSVGITEFIGKQRPFFGVIKHRFDDFIIHEIDADGNIVKLESIDRPDEIELDAASDSRVDASDLAVDKKILQKIREYAKSITFQSTLEIPIGEFGKHHERGFGLKGRAALRNYIRQNYPNLSTKIEMMDGKIVLKVLPIEKKEGVDKLNERFLNERQRWPKDSPNYVHFVLYKENVESSRTINAMIKQIPVKKRNFSIAERKDRRAVTSQRISAYRTSPAFIWQRAQEINERSSGRFHVEVGGFKLESKSIQPMELRGNHYDIILRDVHPLSEPRTEFKANVHESLEEVKSTGFLNYYGPQRFSNHSFDAHRLGVHLLRHDYESLINGILREKSVEGAPWLQEYNDAILIWQTTQDAERALEKMPLKYSPEATLLRALMSVKPGDYAAAIDRAGSQIRLYLSAYQSYLWNMAASYRFREYGLEVVEGDLVHVGPGYAQLENNQQTGGQNVTPTVVGDQIVKVTATNASSFTIHDVVLPLISFGTKFPTNRTEEFIKSALKADNVYLSDFANLQRKWQMEESYRKLLIRPDDLDWRWLRYANENEQLNQTDLDRIQGRRIEPNENGSLEALNIKVSLPVLSYVSSFLRQVTKCSHLSLESKYNQFEGQDGDDDDDNAPTKSASAERN